MKQDHVLDQKYWQKDKSNQPWKREIYHQMEQEVNLMPDLHRTIMVSEALNLVKSWVFEGFIWLWVLLCYLKYLFVLTLNSVYDYNWLFSACSNATLPAIQNSTIASIIHYSIDSDCLRIETCADIPLNISGNIYSKSLKVTFDVEPCSFLLKVEFERSIVTRVLLSYNWGR